MEVFLSYPSSERRLAEDLRHRLEHAGLAVFDPARIAVGQPLQEQVEQAVDAAKLFLVLIDPEGPPSREQQAEWQAALEAVWKDSTKRLIPVLPRGAEVPAFARSASGGRDVQALRLDEERDLDEIVRAAKELVVGRRRGGTARSAKGVPKPPDDVVGRDLWRKSPPEFSPPPPLDYPSSDRGEVVVAEHNADREERGARLAEIRRFADDLKK